jgi:hypothetical protein
VEIGEEVERPGAGPFLAHEQQGDLGGEQEHRRYRAEPVFVDQRRQPFAHGASADLIVGLQEADQGRGGPMGAGFAAPLAALMGRGVALIDEPVRQRASQLVMAVVGEIDVIRGTLAGHQGMGGVVEVIVPLGIVVGCPAGLVAA